MIKLKDIVDLSLLEEHGFKYNDDFGTYKITVKENWFPNPIDYPIIISELRINAWNRKIILKIDDNDKNGLILRKLMELYDLGWIEKVENE